MNTSFEAMFNRVLDHQLNSAKRPPIESLLKSWTTTAKVAAQLLITPTAANKRLALLHRRGVILRKAGARLGFGWNRWYWKMKEDA